MKWPSPAKKTTLLAVIQLAQRAIERQPSSALAWQRLGEAQLKVGACSEAIFSLSEAIRLQPDNAEVPLQLASAYVRTHNYGPALEMLEGYSRRHPDNQAARIQWFESLVAASRLDDAAGLADEIAICDPLNPALFACRARLAMKNDAWQELLIMCDSKLGISPSHTAARYYRSLAMARIGLQEAAASMDLETFVWVGDLPQPPEFPDEEGFRQEILAEILRNPTLLPDPPGFTCRNAYHTEYLEQPDSPAVRVLLSQVRKAVDDYVGRLEGGDPFVTLRPTEAFLSAWAVAYTASGRQLPHFHDKGWLSGTYYASVPKIPDGTHDGALLLGAINIDPPWGIRAIPALPGRLVLFPSWIPHATAPTHVDELRVCVAFDVVRAS